MTASLYQPAYDGVGGLAQPDEADPITTMRRGLQTSPQFSKIAREFYMRLLQETQILKQLNDVRNVRHRVPTISDAVLQCRDGIVGQTMSPKLVQVV